LELKVACDDCGAEAIITDLDVVSTCGEGDQTRSFALSPISMPAGWIQSTTLKRCSKCHQAWRARMEPVWKAEEENRQARLNEHFLRLLRENVPGLIEELDNVGPWPSSDQHRTIRALIFALNTSNQPSKGESKT